MHRKVFAVDWISRSFPLDGAGGLRGQVESDAVYALDLVRDTIRDMGEEREGQLGHRGGHRVTGIDSAEHDQVSFRALAFLIDTDALEVGHDGEVLPHFACETVRGEFFTENSVRFADDFQSLTGDGTDATNAETGAREGLTIYHIVGKTERFAYDADFVLEEELHRLDELEFQILGQSADVVVRLDAVFALQDVGINGTLCEEGDVLLLARFFLKYADELRADDLALGLGLFDACELIEETIHRIYVDEIRIHFIAEDLDDLLGFSFTEKTVIDVYTDEILADRFDEERGNDGAVHAAGEGEQDFLVLYLLFDSCHLLCDEFLSECGGGDSFHCIRTNVRIHF